MGTSSALSKIKIEPSEIVATAAKIPGVHVNREHFLRAQFDKHCDEAMLVQIIKVGPRAAGVPTKTINSVAKHVINHETAQVTLISAAAGLPGGLVAMLGTAAADIVQFQAALIRTSQKLAYIHDWPELFEAKGKNIDDETKDILLLFLGVMYGISSASKGIEKLAGLIAANVAKKLPQKALTKTLIYPIVKKIAHLIGAKMTKQIFSSGISKAIPVAGALISGGVTFASFKPMANRLNLHLSKMQNSKQRALKKAAAPRATATKAVTAKPKSTAQKTKNSSTAK